MFLSVTNYWNGPSEMMQQKGRRPFDQTIGDHLIKPSETI
jgi:hypothetical protein